jgi:hypothetical protein
LKIVLTQVENYLSKGRGGMTPYDTKKEEPIILILL